MDFSFKWPFFKKANKDKITINKEVNNANDELDNVTTFSEKDQLLTQIDNEKLDTIFFRSELNKETISIEFVKKLVDSPSLLDYIVNNIFDSEIINKINNNNLRVSDIDYYYKDLFLYDIFAVEDREIIEIFRKDIDLTDKGYTSFSLEDFKKYEDNASYIDNYINSLMEGESLLISRDKAIPLGDNMLSFGNEVAIYMPLDSDKVFCRDIFNFYYSGDLKFDSDTILFISYNQFLEWIKDSEKLEILKSVQVVFYDDYSKANEIRYSIRDFKFSYHWNTHDNGYADKLLIQVNHLLYLIDNSELSNEKKEYYRYYIELNYNKIVEDNFGYSIYFCEDNLRKLANEIRTKLNYENISKITSDFNQLDIIEKKKDVKQSEFSISIFLNQFDNFEELSPFDFLKSFSRLNNEEKNLVLTDEKVINKLRGLLKESSYDEYHRYEEICKYLNTKDIFRVFDAKFISHFFKTNRDQYQYRFFYKILEKDVNGAIEYLLSDDDYFKLLIKDMDKYDFSNLEYPLLVKFLKKIELDNLEVDLVAIRCTNEINQLNLLKEDFSDNFLVKIVENSNKSVQQFFYLEDDRFKYLWNKFNILNLSSGNFKFNDDVVSKNEFFDVFKSNSMITFRANVDRFLIHQPDIYFEEKISKYEDELISKFDLDSGIFIQYRCLMDNIRILDDRNYFNNSKDFFYDSNTRIECHKYIERDKDSNLYIRDKEGLTNYLQWLSKRKLNEVIIDRLFKDNIYNVFLNIKEMLRYNGKLNDSDKVLNEEQVEFYNTILNIDKLDNNLIIDLYNKFKDKNVALMFYDDLRKLKDKSYDKINEDLFKGENVSSIKDNNLSNKYGVDVIDLRDKDYTMLVRCLGSSYRELSYHKRDCYTILSNDNSSVFHKDDYIYGYSGFDNDCILHIFEGDSFSGDVKGSDLSTGSDRVNRIMTSGEIATSSNWYSEVQIVNKKSEENNSMFETLRPSYLVVYDEISDKVLEEAKRMNIPICIISYVLNKDVVTEFSAVGVDEELRYTKEWGMANESERRKSR